MELFSAKIITIHIQRIFPQNHKWNITKYKYKNEINSFKDYFSISVDSLHSMLFGEFYIIFYVRNRVGMDSANVFVKLRIKEIIYRDNYQVMELDLKSSSYLYKADSYEEIPSKGSIFLRVKTEKASGSLVLKDHDSLAKKILNMFFMSEKARNFTVIINLFMSTQKGTFLCRLQWLLGLISAEYYYNHMNSICDGKHSDNSDCEYNFCQKNYLNLPISELNDASKALQYSIAAFGNSFVIWGIPKKRLLSTIKNSRKRAILEHLNIEESDLVFEYPGNDQSISFIAFYEDNEKMVISFKGTTSGNEALHDINCEYVEFQDGYAHSGMKMLADKFISDYFQQLLENMKSKNISKLLLTGHSLGAATAVLVYLRLLQHKYDSYIQIECICFGCPPLVSLSIANKKYPYLKIYNYGTDIITRLSFGSVLDLKYICISVGSIYDFFDEKTVIIERIREIKLYLKRSHLYEKLYHPGRLFHIRDFKTDTGVTWKYKEVDPLFFDEIICSRKAPFDHIIHRTKEALDYSISKFYSEQNDET